MASSRGRQPCSTRDLASPSGPIFEHVVPQPFGRSYLSWYDLTQDSHIIISSAPHKQYLGQVPRSIVGSLRLPQVPNLPSLSLRLTCIYKFNNHNNPLFLGVYTQCFKHTYKPLGLLLPNFSKVSNPNVGLHFSFIFQETLIHVLVFPFSSMKLSNVMNNYESQRLSFQLLESTSKCKNHQMSKSMFSSSSNDAIGHVQLCSLLIFRMVSLF